MKREILASGAALVAMSTATASYAQSAANSAPAAAEKQDQVEIVVTAQRQAQRAVDVPISISAIGAEEIERRNVTTLDALQYSVPGLSVFDNGGPGQQNVQIRGVSNSLGSPTVGIYLDETPISFEKQGNGLSVRLLDMSRVEVLRGPQPTLYGEGSMGGTIRYIPALANLHEVSGSAEGEYSSTKDGASNYLATGVVNAPLVTDKLGIRLVAGYERVGGFIDSNVTGEEDINHSDTYTVRGNILARPTDGLKLSLLGLYQQTNQDNIDFGVNRRTNAKVPTPDDDKYDVVEFTAVQDLGFADLTGIASYLKRTNVATIDLSSLLVSGPPPVRALASRVSTISYTTDQNYEVGYGEVRLNSRGEGPLRWLLGGTYRDLRDHTNQSSEALPGPVPFVLLASDQHIVSKSFAFYGEVSYWITPRFQATAGLRYFNDEKNQSNVSTNFGNTSSDIKAGTFHTLNPRFNLNYKFSADSMIYASVAKGFRSGGFNVTSGNPIIPPSYLPDKIWTYEVGTKHQLFDKRLSLEGAVYHSKWSDVQSFSFAPGSVIVTTTNSGLVEGWGVDLSASARPARGLTLTGTYGWNNLEYKRAAPGGDKIVGDPVDNAVRESWSASFDYRTPIANDVLGFFRADYQHAGSGQIALRSRGQVAKRPARDLVNLRLGVDLKRVELSLFADNVFDEDAPNIVGPFGLYTENLEQRPRVVGLSARMNF